MNRKKRRPVKQYRPDGQLVREYQSITEAARKIGLSISNISACAMGKCIQASGFVWRYGDETAEEEYHRRKKNSKRVIQYSLNGKKLAAYKNASAAAKAVNASYECIRLALQKKLKTSNGFIWKYESA